MTLGTNVNAWKYTTNIISTLYNDKEFILDKVIPSFKGVELLFINKDDNKLKVLVCNNGDIEYE